MPVFDPGVPWLRGSATLTNGSTTVETDGVITLNEILEGDRLYVMDGGQRVGPLEIVGGEGDEIELREPFEGATGSYPIIIDRNPVTPLGAKILRDMSRILANFEDQGPLIEEVEHARDEAVTASLTTGYVFQTKAEAEGRIVPPLIDTIHTGGFRNPGDRGGARFRRATAEPGHPGKLQTPDGVWWEMQEPVVNYAMFGADLTGVVPADAAMQACHDYANATGAYVVQKWGQVLWRNTEIAVKSDSDLAGLTVRMDAESGSSTGFGPYCYTLSRSRDPINATPVQISQLETIHAAQLRKGSKQCTHPLFTDNPFSLIYVRTSRTYIVRNGTNNIRAHDVVATGQGGNLAYGFDVDCSTQIQEVTVYPKEDFHLTFKCPNFLFDGVDRAGGVFVDRSQATVEIGSVDEPVRVASQRKVFHCLHGWGVTWVNGISSGIKYPGSGTYVMGAEGIINLKIVGFKSWSGWGVTGMNLLKDVVYEDCVLNRYDVHTFCFGMYLVRSTIVNHGVRVSGGGRFVARDCKVVLTGPGLAAEDGDNFSTVMFEARSDYGYEFDGSVTIDGLSIEIASTFTDNISSYILVRTGGAIGYDPGRDVALVQDISIKNVTVSVPAHMGTEAAPFTLYPVILEGFHAGETRNVYWPRSIVIDDIKYTSEQAGRHLRIAAVRSAQFARPGVKVRGYEGDTAARFGTTATVDIRSVRPNVPAIYRGHEEAGLVSLIDTVANWSPGYANDRDGWFPRISIQDCPHVFLDLICKATVLADRSVIHRGDRARSGALAPISFRATSCDIKPVDRAEGDGSAAFDLITGPDASYVGCAFYEPLDDAGIAAGSVSLTNTRGVGNYLVDATDTNYPNAPTGFFQNP